MKIAAILGYDVTDGGGFSQALNAIGQMARLCEGKYEFTVFTSQKKNIEYLNKLGYEACYFRYGLAGKWLSYSATNPLLGLVQSTLKLISGFEKSLLAEAVDLAYFVTTTRQCLALQKLNYITTVWDLCHRDSPEFPEVRSYNEFLSREYIYSNALSQALIVLCDSAELAKRIGGRYGVDSDRLLAMPFAPSPLLEEDYSVSAQTVLSKYQLKPGYFFYPAQFWAHKNHVRILQALKILKDDGISREVVFCGGDHGNLEQVKSRVAEFGLEEAVRLLGFVPADEMRSLYEGCAAVVMPTYFGPTNIPPLEAWKLGKPLIYSAHLSEQAGNAALLVNPDSAEDLADAMQMVVEPGIAADLVQKGHARLLVIDKERQFAETVMSERLGQFSKRLACWSS